MHKFWTAQQHLIIATGSLVSCRICVCVFVLACVHVFVWVSSLKKLCVLVQWPFTQKSTVCQPHKHSAYAWAQCEEQGIDGPIDIQAFLSFICWCSATDIKGEKTKFHWKPVYMCSLIAACCSALCDTHRLSHTYTHKHTNTHTHTHTQNTT